MGAKYYDREEKPNGYIHHFNVIAAREDLQARVKGKPFYSTGAGPIRDKMEDRKLLSAARRRAATDRRQDKVLGRYRFMYRWM